jgi:cell fate regulator YaaT (PSP1 superfamily)
MGCGSCGSTKNGVPGGCKSHGSCKSGGCNRMNVHNWLSDLPMQDMGKPYGIMEVSFNNGSRKDFYKNNTGLLLEKGDLIAVEGVSGFDVGAVSLTGELVKLQMSKRGIKEHSEEIKNILRMATDEDLLKLKENKAKEQNILIRSRAALHILKLDMKLSEVEMQADGKKATFYYVSEERIDYRELIRIYAADFGIKVEMKQIGIRQEAGKLGGIGSCGRELCCSTWLTDFKSVSTVAARYQNLSINQTKLSGQCGRLKCCLNFELDTYMDALKGFPNNADKLELKAGIAFLAKKDIFKNLMWYTMANSSTHYPLTLDRVNEIIDLNKKGIKPDEIGAIEIECKKAADEEKAEFVDTVGLFTLKNLDKRSGGGKSKSKQNRNGQNGGAPSNRPSGNRPPQSASSNNTNKPANPAAKNNAPGDGQPNIARPPRNNNNRNNKPANKPNAGPNPTANKEASTPKPATVSPNGAKDNARFKGNTFGGKKPPKTPPTAE